MTTEPQPTRTAAPLPRSTVDADVAASQPALGANQPAPGELAPESAAPDAAAPPPAAPVSPPAATAAPPLKIKRTRTSGLWVALGFFAVVLLLLLIFILQNGEKVDISYMGAHGHLPLGVALLFAAVCGVLLVILAGAARISQLRTVARRHRRADKKSAQANASANSAR
jgi:lipopolysaccharide assembly protein A